MSFSNTVDRIRTCRHITELAVFRVDVQKYRDKTSAAIWGADLHTMWSMIYDEMWRHKWKDD